MKGEKEENHAIYLIEEARCYKIVYLVWIITG